MPACNWQGWRSRDWFLPVSVSKPRGLGHGLGCWRCSGKIWFHVKSLLENKDLRQMSNERGRNLVTFVELIGIGAPRPLKHLPTALDVVLQRFRVGGAVEVNDSRRLRFGLFQSGHNFPKHSSILIDNIAQNLHSLQFIEFLIQIE